MSPPRSRVESVDRSPAGGPSEDPKRSSSADSIEVGRGKAAVWLGLLGVPSFGLTAIAGLGLGLAGLRSPRPFWPIVGTVISFAVLAGWMGGLVGAIEAMREGLRPPTDVWPAGGRLGSQLARKIAAGVDPADPKPPTTERIAELLEGMPKSDRRFGDPPQALAIEPLPPQPGELLRWRIGAPLDPAAGSSIAVVDPELCGLFRYALDGREIWPIARAVDPDRTALDDREAVLLEVTAPAARAIIAAARSSGGELPDAIEAARLVESLGLARVPQYRPRPGGIFDLVDPATRDRATYVAVGGVLVPVIPY